MNILIKGGKIIDGTGAEPIENGSILIKDKLISKVSSQLEIKKDKNTKVLDITNKTIVPGLMDAHVHLFSGYHLNWTHEKYLPRNITKSVIHGFYQSQRCIKAGVLTIRDAGCTHNGIFEMKDAINSGKILGPRLLCSGTAIGMTGGHAWGGSIEADGPWEIRKAVRSQLRWGADSIKFMETGGSATRYEEITETQMNVEELSAGVEEAKKRNKRTLAHCGNSLGTLNCVEAGVDSIEHGNILNNEALNAMKKAGTFYVPTLYCYWLIANHGDEYGFPEWGIRKSKEIQESHKEGFQKAYKMGIPIAAGTDFGHWGSLIGEDIISELELFVNYGMTTSDAIKSATYMSALNLDIDKSVGTIENGKIADLLIVDGDPIKNISNLRKVWKVFKDGKIVYEI